MFQRFPALCVSGFVVLLFAAITNWRPAVMLTAQASAPNVVTSVSAASYQPALAPEAIAAGFGTGMATQTVVASTVPLPTELAGTTVRVNDVLAPLFFVSPSQINYVIPAGTPAGAATVKVTSGDGTMLTGTVQVRNAAPARFSRRMPAAVAFRQP